MRVIDPRDAHCTIYTFGSKRQYPPACQYIIDVSNWRDPMGQPSLKNLDGRDIKVKNWIDHDPKTKALIETVGMILLDACPPDTSKSWTSIGLRDFHGKWIAPALGELIMEFLDHSPRHEHIGTMITHLDLYVTPIKSQWELVGRGRPVKDTSPMGVVT